VPLQLRTLSTGALDVALQLGDDDLDALRTAALLSLRCDARAGDADEVPDLGSRRGYWGDAYDTLIDAADPPGPLGSRLWLLDEAIPSEPNARRAEAYALEALSWMTTAKLVRLLSVTCTASEQGLDLTVSITSRSGKTLVMRAPLAPLVL
jgi:phage gp46-like protein